MKKLIKGVHPRGSTSPLAKEKVLFFAFQTQIYLPDPLWPLALAVLTPAVPSWGSGVTARVGRAFTGCCWSSLTPCVVPVPPLLLWGGLGLSLLRGKSFI